jgi:hypothetical protein
MELNKTWLNGKYKNGEINTSLPFVSVNDPEFYADGENAEIIIGDIYNYWLNGKIGQEDAFNWWINLNL